MSFNKLQKITNGLLRDVAHSIYQGVLYLQYIVQFTVHHKRNSIYAHDKSTDFFPKNLQTLNSISCIFLIPKFTRIW